MLDPRLPPRALRGTRLKTARRTEGRWRKSVGVSVVTQTDPIRGYAPNVPQTASPEILERFKEGFECWNGGELDLMQDTYAEDGEFDLSAVFTDTRPYRGREDMRRQWDEIWEAWEGVRMDPIQVFDVGDGRFVVDVRLWGKGKRSGGEVDQRFAYLYTLRESDEKIVRCQLFLTVQTAMDVATASASAAQSGSSNSSA
jgi:ketosteroid isomerase-like protein